MKRPIEGPIIIIINDAWLSSPLKLKIKTSATTNNNSKKTTNKQKAGRENQVI